VASGDAMPYVPKHQASASIGLESARFALNVSGTYVAETAPGSGSFHNNPAYRLRAAVVETPSGSYFVKLVGPEKTVTQWNDSFVSYLKSFQFK